jgi:hypothetical protein
VPATKYQPSKAASSYSFLLRPLTVLMKETKQAVSAIKQSILLRCLWFPPTDEWRKENILKILIFAGFFRFSREVSCFLQERKRNVLFLESLDEIIEQDPII